MRELTHCSAPPPPIPLSISPSISFYLSLSPTILSSSPHFISLSLHSLLLLLSYPLFLYFSYFTPPTSLSVSLSPFISFSPPPILSDSLLLFFLSPSILPLSSPSYPLPHSFLLPSLFLILSSLSLSLLPSLPPPHLVISHTVPPPTDNSKQMKVFLPSKLLECLPRTSSLPKERLRWNTNEVSRMGGGGALPDSV